jgi:hypothetical protein
MPSYLGVVIEQSLADRSCLETIEIVHREKDPNGDWVFLLVRVPEAGSAGVFARLQSALRRYEPWYAHFFRGTELVVVYGDAVVATTTDPATWGPAIAHGVKLGIPEEQLDFFPHTIDQVAQRFGIRPNSAPRPEKA